MPKKLSFKMSCSLRSLYFETSDLNFLQDPNNRGNKAK